MTVKDDLDQFLAERVSLPALPLDELDLTDTGNAQRFVELAEGTVRYVHGWGSWTVYEDGRWIIDVKDALVTETAKVVARSLLAMVPRIEDKDDRQRVFVAAQRAESDSAIRHMIHLARAIPGVIVAHEELDAEPDILNVLNGTVELRTGELLRASDSFGLL
jgi:putative DNA primase/helicase